MEIKDDLYYLQDINKEEGPSKSELYNIAFLETSEKRGDNIKNAFTQLVEQANKSNISKVKNNERIKEKNYDRINLVNKDEEEPKKKDVLKKTDYFKEFFND